MKKTMMLIVLFAVLVVSVAAYSGRVYQPVDGYKAPGFSVCNADTSLSVANLKGRYVLVNFWASTDAESRIQNQEYDSFCQSLSQERFCLLSVNVDRNERLFREIVRNDNLNAEAQFRVDESCLSRVARDYHLTKGLRSFLIDPEGRIVATNPSSSTLTQVLSE
ncbi:MAG: redoxin domain-containing protein [Muribaculaceae bacterium]|nr:redoxin domain-containing protein [Muribaculaceae bacterium]